MNREALVREVFKHLDIDKDGKVRVNDVVALIGGNVKKALFIGLAAGAAAGVVVGYVLKALVG